MTKPYAPHVNVGSALAVEYIIINFTVKGGLFILKAYDSAPPSSNSFLHLYIIVSIKVHCMVIIMKSETLTYTTL